MVVWYEVNYILQEYEFEPKSKLISVKVSTVHA